MSYAEIVELFAQTCNSEYRQLIDELEKFRRLYE